MTQITRDDVEQQLKEWRKKAANFVPEPGCLDASLDLSADAAQTIDMAERANISLEDLVPDAGERELLRADAECAQLNSSKG